MKLGKAKFNIFAQGFINNEFIDYSHYDKTLIETKAIIKDMPSSFGIVVVMLKPKKYRLILKDDEDGNGVRAIEGYSNLELTYDLFCSNLYDKNRMSCVKADANGPGGWYISR